MINAIEEKYMYRCLELAGKGIGKTRSNPMVGAVIVYNSKIIGEGYHQEFGGPHAEVNAVHSVKDKSLLKDSTLYVNLEPCSHYGKTPPCSMLIKDTGIENVVIGARDPNPLVAGGGISFLQNNGINISLGLLENECRWLNRRFYTFYEQKRPYIILKWARSLDGYIDNRDKNFIESPPLNISNKISKFLAHKWRSEEMGIMAGTNTINWDNPSLDVRLYFGRNPERFTFEGKTGIRKDAKILNDGMSTVIFTKASAISNGNVEYVNLADYNQSLDQVMTELHKRNILSLIVEGGSKLIENFILQDLWDEARIFTGKIYADKGLKAPVFDQFDNLYSIVNDTLSVSYRKKY
jgi:diaminohydroxyphosphoribosylaminopyrimidine deaminase / 5-amino-6-(5-phosphoribosylamino)uracil reductase